MADKAQLGEQKLPYALLYLAKLRVVYQSRMLFFEAPEVYVHMTGLPRTLEYNGILNKHLQFNRSGIYATLSN